MNPPRNNAETTRGRPFATGNAGRPRGARNRTSLAVEALLEGEAERLTRRAIEAALGGDVTALRLCLDRISPARRDRCVSFEVPPLEGIGSLPGAVAMLLRAVAAVVTAVILFSRRRGWLSGATPDEWMSDRWLAEHRASHTPHD